MTVNRGPLRRFLQLVVWCIVAASAAGGQSLPVQETALQKLKRWVADRLKIDFLLYDRITRFRGGDGETNRASTVRVFDFSVHRETDVWECAGCRSPVMVGPAEVLVLSEDGHVTGYDLSNRTSSQYSGQTRLAMLVAGLPAEREFIGLVSDDGENDGCKLKASAFAISGKDVVALKNPPGACAESAKELFLPGALRNGRLIQSSQGPLKRLTVHEIVQTGGEYLVKPGDSVSRTLDNDGISRFSPVWIDDTRILYLADR